MGQHSERLCQPPLRECVGRIALVVDRERTFEPLILQVRIEICHVLGQHHALVDHAAARQRTQVQLSDTSGQRRLFNPAADHIKLPLKRFLIDAFRVRDDDLLNLNKAVLKSLKATDGKTYRLSDLTGKKVVVISFWNIACKPCRKEMPKLQELYDELKDRGLEILAINTDGPSDLPGVKPLVRRKGFTYPVLLDTEQKVVKLYNPRCILPYTAVIDLDGKVVHTHLGYNSGDELKLKEEILKLLPGEGEGAAGDTTSAEGEDDRG